MKRTRIVGIYLAAGKSSRFGKNKLFVDVNGRPLGSIALYKAICSQLDAVVVVTSPNDNLHWIEARLLPYYKHRWYIASCNTPSDGQSSSIKCGLSRAEKLHADAVMTILADQPLITINMINTLILKYKQIKMKQINFLASIQKGIFCPPIIFSQSMFPSLYKLKGDKGARHLIKQEITNGEGIAFHNPHLFFDVDTTEDYQTLLRL